MATLERCEKKRTTPAAEDLAFLAMAHFKLGHIEQARSALDKLQTVIKNPGPAAGTYIGLRWQAADLQDFLHEAVSLIGGPSAR